MGKKYIIELEDAPFIRLNNVNGHCEKNLYRVKGFNSLVFDWNGLQILTPYTEPNTDTCIDYLHKQGWLQDHDKQITESEYKRGYKDGTEAVVIPEDKVHEAYQRGYSAGKVDAYDEDAKKITKWIKKSEEAYKKGYEDGFIAGHEKADKAGAVFYNDGYKCGLNEAWEVVQKIGCMSIEEQNKLFGCFGVYLIAHEFSASEAIEKIRQYEQEQEEIKVWDEVNGKGGKGVITRMSDDGNHFNIMWENGSTGYYMIEGFKKTGRNFPEIAEVLKKMQEEKE